MVHPNKKQKVYVTCKEEVLFNTDTLSKIISYLPSVDLLSLALTSKRFGASNTNNDSIIKESTRIVIQDIITNEQLAALPHYDGESSLADYHYLQLMIAPLAFDQLVGTEYVNEEDKSCVRSVNIAWGTAFSNNVLRAGKHYVSFTSNCNTSANFIMVGVMRPGQANHLACGNAAYSDFYRHFSRRLRYEDPNNNKFHCCLYNALTGKCRSNNWKESQVVNINEDKETWEGMESMSPGDNIGMLLDLDEGTLSVYRNGRKLGVMRRGLAGQYCWVVSLCKPAGQVTIKRGKIPPI